MELAAARTSDTAPTKQAASRQLTSFSYLSGFGMNVPERVVTNAHFESYLDTNDEWIRERTGIVERRWVEPGTGASTLAEAAARKAIAMAGLQPEEIDGIVVATVSPDFLFPSAACLLQAKLGCKNVFAFDLNAACSGFIYGLTVADGMIAAGRAKNVLLVGVDIFSSLVNPNDRSTCILFGDGAGAVVLSSTDRLSSANASVSRGMRGQLTDVRGILASHLGSDGHQSEILCVPTGSAAPVTAERIANNEQFLHMAGREVFKLAVRGLADASEEVLKKAGVSVDEIDHYLSHQANKRILDAVGKQLKIPAEKVFINVHKYGNTSAASVPILLAEAVESGRVKPGDTAILSAFGGGVTWGAILLRF